MPKLLCGEIVGFSGIKIVLKEAELMNLVVRKSFRGQGIGSQLLSHIISFSKTQNLSHIFLEVNENNKTAIRLYQKHGFQTVGTRKNYYQGQNAILMKI